MRTVYVVANLFKLALELQSFRLTNRQQSTNVSRGKKSHDELKPKNNTTSTLDAAKKMQVVSDIGSLNER